MMLIVSARVRGVTPVLAGRLYVIEPLVAEVFAIARRKTARGGPYQR
jgi:hypothetical protein